VKRHRTADLEPTAFGGRYTLLRRLAIGGMAEIYLARQAAMAGFEKEVVIKRLRAELADDPRIVEMFLDEARIGALLNHPNIVHVYDVDEQDGIPYIAMEYIVGEELNELCRRGLTHGRFLPIEHAVELIRQAAAGMGYFHAKRGAEGTPLVDEPLEIVHLDISPTNLLVTQDGTMKIIDFGIARARGQRSRGDVIPGKLSYMSPEQAARSQDVDHRSDIFSLGIVLYEITVGKRLFRGPANEVVAKLVDGQIEPPTFARRNFPAALEAIVMRALEKHPSDRYQSAYDLADDLETFLRDERLHSGPVRIARYLDMLTHAAGGQRRPELVSEAEVRRAEGGDDLDFDSQVFDGFKPSEGAPGPEQAPEWEDAEQPEADVAKALGMELAELRALRTPVPMRPSGMAPVSGKEPRPVAPDEEPSGATNPIEKLEPEEVKPAAKKRAITDEGDGDPGDVDVSTDEDDPPTRPITPTPMPAAKPASEGRASKPGFQLTPAEPAAAVSPVKHPRAQTPVPIVGSSLLARSAPSKLPWVLVAALVMAVLGLVAYIVMK
jgi:serine/threonine protein kinase